jgi:hypothetical protein
LVRSNPESAAPSAGGQLRARSRRSSKINCSASPGASALLAHSGIPARRNGAQRAGPRKKVCSPSALEAPCGAFLSHTHNEHVQPQRGEGRQHVELLSSNFGVDLFCRRDNEPHEGIEAMASAGWTTQGANVCIMDRLSCCDIDGNLGFHATEPIILAEAARR